MNSDNGNKSNKVYGPYSPVRDAGGLLFISGQVGIEPGSVDAWPDVAKQTTQAIENLGSVLSSAGASLTDVIKTTVFLTDMSNFGIFNAIYTDYFNESKPARSTVAVAELPRVGGSAPILVEIEAIAIKK